MYKYYLFGGSAIQYYKIGIDHLIYHIHTRKENLKYDIFKYKICDDPNDLLIALSKWFNYVQITEDEYNFLNEYKKDYDENE